MYGLNGIGVQVEHEWACTVSSGRFEIIFVSLRFPQSQHEILEFFRNIKLESEILDSLKF